MVGQEPFGKLDALAPYGARASITAASGVAHGEGRLTLREHDTCRLLHCSGRTLNLVSLFLDQLPVLTPRTLLIPVHQG